MRDPYNDSIRESRSTAQRNLSDRRVVLYACILSISIAACDEHGDGCDSAPADTPSAEVEQTAAASIDLRLRNCHVVMTFHNLPKLASTAAGQRDPRFDHLPSTTDSSSILDPTPDSGCDSTQDAGAQRRRIEASQCLRVALCGESECA